MRTMSPLPSRPGFIVGTALLVTVLCCGAIQASHAGAGSRFVTAAGPRHRVLVSTDIGGTDFDDFQSMVHLLLYADSVDIEGLVSSPYGPGRKEHILRVVEHYERDYQNLKSHSDRYPTAGALRAVTKQGALDVAGWAGFSAPTEGSDWIVTCARRDDPRPLHVLVWGGIEDLAQALHDAPDILPKLRVYFIGGPNKKWSVDAYHYIATHHLRLWIIEANATYRGWFTGGNQSGEWGNTSFVAAHIAGHGALGEFFARGISFDSMTRSTLKMGDTPSLGWLLHGTPGDPSQPGWGGQFVRAWERPYRVFDRLTTSSDEIEQFGVVELALPAGDRAPGQPEARVLIENQSLSGFLDAKGAMRFRFSPKDAKVYDYTIRANIPALDGRTGAFTAVRPPPHAALRPSPRLPNWWTDDPSPAVADGTALGAKTVSRWREAFLRDFAARMRRCASPASPPGAIVGENLTDGPSRRLSHKLLHTQLHGEEEAHRSGDRAKARGDRG